MIDAVTVIATVPEPCAIAWPTVCMLQELLCCYAAALLCYAMFCHTTYHACAILIADASRTASHIPSCATGADRLSAATIPVARMMLPRPPPMPSIACHASHT